MKKWATLLAGSACALSLFSGSVAADENKQLVFMNWGPYINSNILEQFTEETGIKVIYSTYESNETLYAKLKTHNQGYDLVVPSTYFVAKMRDEGMLQKIDKSKLNKGQYLNIDIATRDETNQYGQNVSVYYSQTAEQRKAKEPKAYLGNGRVVWTDGNINKAEFVKENTTEEMVDF